jgi:hypothetical protein
MGSWQKQEKRTYVPSLHACILARTAEGVNSHCKIDGEEVQHLSLVLRAKLMRRRQAPFGGTGLFLF